jgi:cellulose biosynthesis protein BcsQ
MAHSIGVVQVKCGAGRSTIATNLAGMFATKYRAALIDPRNLP